VKIGLNWIFLYFQLLQQSGSGPNAGALSNLGNLGLGEYASDIFNRSAFYMALMFETCAVRSDVQLLTVL